MVKNYKEKQSQGTDNKTELPEGRRVGTQSKGGVGLIDGGGR